MVLAAQTHSPAPSELRRQPLGAPITASQGLPWSVAAPYHAGNGTVEGVCSTPAEAA